MENSNLLPSERLPKSHTFALVMLALAVLVLPLAVVAAQLTTNLSSKAYTPPVATTSGTISGFKPIQRTCEGAVDIVTYGKSCSLPGTITPMPPVVRGATPQPTIRLPKSTGYDSATVNCVGGYSETITPNIARVGSEDTGSIQAATAQSGVAVSVPVGTTYTAPAGGTDNTKSTGGFARTAPLPTTCYSSDELQALAKFVCSKQSACPTPTPTTACNTALQKYSLISPCAGPMSNPRQGGTPTSARQPEQQSYRAINYTCADGTTHVFNSSQKSCVSPEALIKEATVACQDKVILKKSFTKPCTVNAGEIDKNVRYVLPRPSTSGYNNISFVCPDNFASSYSPIACTSQSDLTAYANKVCHSHLICSTGKVTPTPEPTILIGRVKCGTKDPICPKGTICETIGIMGGYCTPISVITSPTPKIPTTITPTKDPAVSGLTITSTSLVQGMMGTPYRAVINIIDPKSSPALTTTISGLPTGLIHHNCAEIDTARGIEISCSITGTPTKAGSFTVTTSTRDGSSTRVVTKSLVLDITPAGPRPLSR